MSQDEKRAPREFPDRCPVCGTPVRVVGDVTKSYESAYDALANEVRMLRHKLEEHEKPGVHHTISAAQWDRYQQLERELAEVKADFEKLMEVRRILSKMLTLTEEGEAKAEAERDALRAENERLRRALDLALYYVEGDATWEALKAKVDCILEGEE